MWIFSSCGGILELRWGFQASSCVGPGKPMGNTWGNSGNSVRLYFGGSKITADCDGSHEIKRCLLLGRKVMTNLDSKIGRAHV